MCYYFGKSNTKGKMDKLTRFGVSLESGLLEKFDKHAKKRNYKNRSEALRDLIREELVRDEWLGSKEVAGVITLVYDHHKRELVNKSTEIQHDYHKYIISSQHIHLDHHNCLETIIVKGQPMQIKALADKLQSTKGIKFGTLTAATTGKELI